MQSYIADDPKRVRVHLHNACKGVLCTSRGLIAHQHEVADLKLLVFNDLFMAFLQIRQVLSHPPLPEVINSGLYKGIAS